MRSGFQGINARFDGLEAELRYRFEQLDRLEEQLGGLVATVRDLGAFFRGRFNGKGER
jgi:hypothetical protein